MIELIVFPIAGAFIGWLTNYLAIKSIFHPYQPIIIPILNYKLQGLIPKRRTELAKSIGQVIKDELLSVEDLTSLIKSKELLDKLSNSIIDHFQIKIIEKIPGFLPLKIKGLLLEISNDVLIKQIPQYLKNAIEKFAADINHHIDIGLMVENKINSFEIKKLETMIFKVAKKELRHIEFLGGLLGFIIGLFQIMLLLFLGYFNI